MFFSDSIMMLHHFALEPVMWDMCIQMYLLLMPYICVTRSLPYTHDSLPSDFLIA